MSTPNNYTTVDRRPKLSCGCGCSQEATLPHFAKHDGNYILPGCLDSHKERKASQRRLREIVVVYGRFWQRLAHAREVYRLQRGIFDRQGAAVARRSALRTAMIYLLGQRVGLWGSLLWRK